MSWMAQRNATFNKINEQLTKIYEKTSVAGQECFKHARGKYFRLFEFPGSNALCIEYAENYEEAQKNRFEDGDRFFLGEFSEEEMLNAMLEEIEDASV